MKSNSTNISREEASKKLVPELRFPEFVNEGEWMDQLLGNCLSQTPDYGLNAPAIPYSLLKPTYLRITDIDDNGRFVSDKKMSVETEMTDKNSLAEGDIVFARTGASVGKVYKYRVEDGPLVFAGFLIRVRPNISKYSSEYIFQYLFTDAYKRWVQVTSARSGQPGINSNEYASLRIPFPTLNEQRQIAQCLSSLDELIAATKEKVVLLKEHKRGLIQKLFPAKGKTLPELRFPEFMNEGEWEEVYLGDVFTERVESNCTYLPLLSLGQDGVYPQSESSKRDISNKDKSKYKRICPNDIGYNTMRMWQGRSALSQIEGIVSPAYTIITPKKGMDPLFLSILLKLPYVIRDFHSHSQGLVNDTLNCKFNDFAKVKAKIPSLIEQQKIASILSSLADEIEQYSEIVKALEIHKKGMMQKLFPQ